VQRAFFVLALLAGCGDPTTHTFAITTHALPGECGLGDSARAPVELELLPLGDYAAAPSVRLPLAGSAPLAVPDATRAFAARIAAAERSFIGYSERTAGAELPILLWPAGRACRLSRAEREYPVLGGGQGLGYDPMSRRVLLVGGDDQDLMNKSAEMLGFDAGTGGLVEGRSLEDLRVFATVTPFGGRLLVAGGEDPVNSRGEVVAPSDTAEVIDPGGDPAVVGRVGLRVARTRHAATVLPNGDTLLVGGRGPFGDALNLLEVISPRGSGANLADYPSLRAPRFFPTVLPLDDGRLFIGGGTAADASPLSVFEWLSRDARTRVAVETPEELPPRHDRAFAAMPGGGVLVVGGCAPRDSSSDDDCGVCRSGCPPAGGAYDAWWILPDDTLHRLDSFALAAPRPVLLGDDAGRPILAPGTGDALYVFDPWRAEFDVLAGMDVPCPPRAGLPAIGLGDETFFWVGECDSPALFGMRRGTRGRYARDVEWAPDRPPSGLVEPDGDRLVFAPGSNVVVYASGDYADFTLELDLAAESAVPRLMLTAVERVGPLAIDLPDTPARVVRITRTGSKLTVAGAAHDVPAGRLRVGLAGGDGTTNVAATLVRGR
jgi:hypothetical protein